MMRSKESVVSVESALRDFKRGGIFEGGAALDVFDLALFGELAKASGKFLDDGFFPGAQAGQDRFWRAGSRCPNSLACWDSSMSFETRAAELLKGMQPR